MPLCERQFIAYFVKSSNNKIKKQLYIITSLVNVSVSTISDQSFVKPNTVIQGVVLKVIETAETPFTNGGLLQKTCKDHSIVEYFLPVLAEKTNKQILIN